MIEAHELTKRYGDTTAMHSLSFTIAPGTVTGFLGPNGAGKSTTMRMIMGLDRPTWGTVTVNGKPYRQHRARCGRSAPCLRQAPCTPAACGPCGHGTRTSRSKTKRHVADLGIHRGAGRARTRGPGIMSQAHRVSGRNDLVRLRSSPLVGRLSSSAPVRPPRPGDGAFVPTLC